MIFLSLLLLFSPLAASSALSDEAGSVSSSNASYDGQSLLLSGHVVLDHGLGKMTAEEASLQRQELGKDFPFSLIHLHKEVRLALKNSAELLCDAAELDFTSLKGYLTATATSRVIYTDKVKTKKEAVPFTLTGNAVELTFSKQAQAEQKTSYDIESILIKDQVEIDYAHLFLLNADHACYRKEPSSQQPTKEFQGLVTAYPKDSQSRCHITHSEDRITADIVDLDVMHSTLTLLHPEGTLASCLFAHLKTNKLYFKSDHLIWNHVKNILHLKGHIEIHEESLGLLKASEELDLIQSPLKDKPSLQAIQTRGPATFIYHAPSFKTPHKLMCYGTLKVDRDKLQATLDSPEQDGHVLSGQQLYYEEEEFGVFANQASLEYSTAANMLQPVSLQLKGNVRLFSHDPNIPPRCGLADRAQYSLTTRTLILAAHPGRKVLFWDASQGVRISAPEVHITYDPDTNHHQIRGVGKVQLAFTDEEHALLSQFFPHYKVSYD